MQEEEREEDKQMEKEELEEEGPQKIWELSATIARDEHQSSTDAATTPRSRQQQQPPFATDRSNDLSAYSNRIFVYGDGADSAEAYSSIAVTSALTFGFAVTTFVTVEAGGSFEPPTHDYSKVCHILFDIAMALTIVLAALGFSIMNLQYYQVRRMRVVRPENLPIFLRQTFSYRHFARGATWISLALYLSGLCIYAISIWQFRDVAVAVVVAIILGTGALSVVVVWLRLNETYMSVSGKRDAVLKRKRQKSDENEHLKASQSKTTSHTNINIHNNNSATPLGRASSTTISRMDALSLLRKATNRRRPQNRIIKDDEGNDYSNNDYANV